jgi:hypothetical protein
MMPCSALLLGLCNKVLDTVHPGQFVRQHESSGCDKTHTIALLHCKGKRRTSVPIFHTSENNNKTHLDPAVIGTASFTRSERGFPEDADSFFPPMDAKTAPPVAKSVPNVRYSVLMARPKMTLPMQ